MLGNVLLQRPFEQDNRLLEGQIELLFSDCVLDDAQRGGIDCFRQHLVSPLEGIDAVDQVDAQLIDIHKSVGELNQSIAFTLTVWFRLCSRTDGCSSITMSLPLIKVSATKCSRTISTSSSFRSG